MRILIIDDEIIVADLLADALRLEGHDVLVATDGDEGLALFRQEQVDAVFLDVFMPETSGLDVLRRIRGLSATVPVILVTGAATAMDLSEARRLNVTEIVQKPDILKNVSGALDRIHPSGSHR